jgi:cardiolipin hydrolase
MEPSTIQLPIDVKRTHDKISNLYSSNDELKPDAATLQDLSRHVSKMKGRFSEDNIQATIDHIFKLALDRMESDKDKTILKGLRSMVREVEEDLYQPNNQIMDAFFFPNLENVKKIQMYIKKAKRTLDLCIFSFSNDDLANEIIAAHKRGVKVRIVTDDEAMTNKGADAQRCSDEGIIVRTDSEQKFHMHNKYMCVDSAFVLTGSFNWTYQAGKSNQENVIVVDDDFLVKKYDNNFSQLWAQFSGNELEH